MPNFPEGYIASQGYCVEHQRNRPCELCLDNNFERAGEVTPRPGTAILKSLDTGLDLWAGGFGDDYTERNQVDWWKRVPFWERVWDRTHFRSAFENGCNAGWNMSAIQVAAAPFMVTLAANDVNPRACGQARAAGLEAFHEEDVALCYDKFELVFTAGVLIHIEPELLEAKMKALIAKSYRWVLAIEYADVVERQIEYRGHIDKCWARPYGDLYEALGVNLIDHGEAEGFDQCHYWLMERSK